MSDSLVSRSSALLNRLAHGVEQADWLDRPSEWAAGVLGKALSPRALTDLLTGSAFGHPLHPPLVAIPIGSWTAATCLDVLRADESAAQTLIGIGIVSAVPTALSGAADWLSTTGAERRVGSVHSILNSTALLLYSGSWWERHRGNRGRAIGLSLAGLAAISVSGWLGGHLVYALGVGVDTTSFQHLPEEWTDLIPERELTIDRPMRCDVAGVPLLVARTCTGIHVVADRCSHRGGPLHDGTVKAGCITCPWHGSTFRLEDGEVVSGPASRPQTVLDVRVIEGQVQVRRSDESRTLRTNPVGV